MGKMRGFLRKAAISREPLAMTMAGVRMGERALQIGVGDAALTALLAARPGISGHSAIVVGDDAAAARARSAAAESGALVDVHRASLAALPLADASFDVIVVHGAAQALAPLDQAARTQAMRECLRVLRPGGRIVTIEAGTRSGLSALVRRGPAVDPAYDGAGGTGAVLEGAGFRPVRLLADREGFRFFEGLKT